MTIVSCKIAIVKLVKRLFRIKNFTLFCRRKKQRIEKMFYRKKYTSDDIIEIVKASGVKPGHPLIVHSAYGNLYNYQGSADELIDRLLEYLGPDGTLCMPAFPKDKYNANVVFDVNNEPSAAGYLTEVFRKKNGVKRSANKLHSVCALGKDADLITGDHHNSRICFDEHSPFYIIGQLDGYILNLGLPKWYVGTGEHVCEALLFSKLRFFQNKFSKEIEFHSILQSGEIVKYKTLTKSVTPYVRCKSTKLFDKNFKSSFYRRTKLSNIWVTLFDMKYTYTRLYELALEGKTIYVSPKYQK